MASNPNGQNEVNITIPCCDKGVLTVNFKSVDNKPAAEAFKAIMRELGIDTTFAETRKGGGGP